MSQSINLIPKEEKIEQAKERLVKGSTVFTVLLLLAVGGFGAYTYIRNTGYQSKIDNYNSQIENLRSDINKLSEIEIAARNLDKKSTALEELITSMPRYSTLFLELAKRTPPGISINTVSLRATGSQNDKPALDISGNGDDYLTVSKFITSLTDTKLSSASPGKEALFNDVVLNSVGLDRQTRVVNYRVTVGYDLNLLTE